MVRRLLLLGAALLAAVAGLGLSSDGSGRILWSFLPGRYEGNYDANGVPKHLAAARVPAAELVDRVKALLPDRQRLPSLHPDLLADDDAANPRLARDASVFVTFVQADTVARNAFGFFEWHEGEQPRTRGDVDETVVFPNATAAHSAGAPGLHAGDTVDLGRFRAGSRLGFFLAAGGFDAVSGVKQRQDQGHIFYTLEGLNPERDHARRGHAVLLHDRATGTLVLGMEDMLRDGSSDEDFNDLVFVVTADPPDAFDPATLRPLPAAPSIRPTGR